MCLGFGAGCARTHGAKPMGRREGLATTAVCHGQHAGHDCSNLGLQGASRSAWHKFLVLIAA